MSIFYKYNNVSLFDAGNYVSNSRSQHVKLMKYSNMQFISTWITIYVQQDVHGRQFKFTIS